MRPLPARQTRAIFHMLKKNEPFAPHLEPSPKKAAALAPRFARPGRPHGSTLLPRGPFTEMGYRDESRDREMSTARSKTGDGASGQVVGGGPGVEPEPCAHPFGHRVRRDEDGPLVHPDRGNRQGAVVEPAVCRLQVHPLEPRPLGQVHTHIVALERVFVVYGPVSSSSWPPHVA